MTSEPVLAERTIGGLHDFLLTRVLPAYARPGARAVDLGAGSGALAQRLKALGLRVEAVELCREEFRADVPLTVLDLNRSDFASALGEGQFELVTAVEVIEHLESPLSFLRNVRRLLAPGGRAVVTTPNVDSAAARVKFLLTGKLRMMDERGDTTHLSPIFLDLLVRQYLPRAGLGLIRHDLYPPAGYLVTRARYAWALRLLARVLPGAAAVGDSHILVLGADE